VDAAGRMCHISYILIVEDNCIITVVWYHIGMEEIDFTYFRRVVKVNLRSVLFIDVIQR
jgi:hypothetical protein